MTQLFWNAVQSRGPQVWLRQKELGIWRAWTWNQTAEAVRAALDIGYRHIDTAQMYGNEAGVGQGIRDAGLARDQVYVTSKLHNGAHRPDDARRAFDGTLAALGSDHVDLFLIHWPLPTRYDGDFLTTWKVLEEFAADLLELGSHGGAQPSAQPGNEQKGSQRTQCDPADQVEQGGARYEVGQVGRRAGQRGEQDQQQQLWQYRRIEKGCLENSF